MKKFFIIIFSLITVASNAQTVSDLGNKVISLYLLDDATDEIGSNDGSATDVTFTGGKGAFNGSSSKIDYPADIASGGSSGSIWGWIQATTTGYSYRSAFGKFYGWYFIGIDGSGRWSGEWNGENVYTSGSYTTGLHFLAVTYDGAMVRFFVDDVQVDSAIMTSANTHEDEIYQAGSYGNDSWWWNGDVYELGIGSSALTKSELTTLFNSGSIPNWEDWYYSAPELPASPMPAGSWTHYIKDQSGTYNEWVDWIGPTPATRQMYSHWITPVSAPVEPPLVADVYVDPVDGDDGGTGAVDDPIQTIDELNDRIAAAGTAITIGLADTAHYGTVLFASVNGTSSDMYELTTWNKYGTGRKANIYQTKLATGWTGGTNDLWNYYDTDLPSTEYQQINFGSAWPRYQYFLNGIFINSDWYQTSMTPDLGDGFYSFESVAGDFESYATDNQLGATSNQYSGAWAYISTEDWIGDKVKITSNTSTTLYFRTSDFFDYNMYHQPSAALKYRIMNDVPDQYGEWRYEPSANTITLLWPNDPDLDEVYVPLDTSGVAINNSSYIYVHDINVLSGNKYGINVEGSNHIYIQENGAYYTAYASILVGASYDVYVDENEIQHTNGNGIVFGVNLAAGQVHAYSNYLHDIGVNGVLNDRDGNWGQGIMTLWGNSAVDYKYNYVDSLGYIGMSYINYSANVETNPITFFGNFVTGSNWHLQDGGAYYFGGSDDNIAKTVINNFGGDMGTDYRFRRGTETPLVMAFYFDLASAYWTCWNNTAWNVQTAYFNQYNANRNSYRYNKAYKFDVEDFSYNYGSGFYKEANTDYQSDYITWSDNEVVVADADGSTAFTWSDDGSPAYNGITTGNNKYVNPFRSDSKIMARRINWNPKTFYTLAEFRASASQFSSWENGTTYNPQEWLYSDVSGITPDQFTWLFKNWSNGTHVFNLGDCSFVDIDGNSVSGTVSVSSYYSKFLFYVSGDPETVDDQLWPTSGIIVPHETPEPIRQNIENPHYFTYNDQATIVISSSEHYAAVLNLDFDYESYLQTLADDGLNGVRISSGANLEYDGWFSIDENTWAPDPETGYIGPWARSSTSGYYGGGNKFDLTDWDEDYFTRLKDFMTEAEARDIIVQYFFFTAIYDDELWNYNPMKYSNNINSVGNTTRANAYSTTGDLYAYQLALVAKIVTELNEYPNLIWELANEPYTTTGGMSQTWRNDVAQTIIDTEAGLSNTHLISNNEYNYYSYDSDTEPEYDVLVWHYANQAEVYEDNLTLPQPRILGNNETGFSQADSMYRREMYVCMLSGGAFFLNLDYAFTVADPTGQTVPSGNPAGGGATLREQYGIAKQYIDLMIQQNPIQYWTFSHSKDASGVWQYRAQNESTGEYYIFLRGESSTNVSTVSGAGSYNYEWINTKTGALIDSGTFTNTGQTGRSFNPPSYTEDILFRIYRID